MGQMTVFFPDGTDFQGDVLLYIDDPVMYQALMDKFTLVEGQLTLLDVEAFTELVSSLVREDGRVLYVDPESEINSGPGRVVAGYSLAQLGWAATMYGHDITSSGGGGVFVGEYISATGSRVIAVGSRIEAGFNGGIIISDSYKRPEGGAEIIRIGGNNGLFDGVDIPLLRSLVIGDNVTFDGSGVTIVGRNNTALGEGSALGRDNSSTQGSFVVGRDNEATGGSLAVGQGNEAAAASVALGRDNKVTNGGSLLAVGVGNTMTGGGATTMLGKENQSSADGLAVGESNTANGGVAVGRSNSTVSSALALGVGNTAESTSQAVGSGNTAGSGGVAHGRDSAAYAGSVAFGIDAVAGDPEDASSASAFGPAAKATHDAAVAVGSDSETTLPAQVAVGPRHFEAIEVGAPGLPVAGAARWWAEGGDLWFATSEGVQSLTTLAAAESVLSWSGAVTLGLVPRREHTYVVMLTGNTVLTLPDVPEGDSFVVTLDIMQDTTGGRTLVIKDAATSYGVTIDPATGANQRTIINLYGSSRGWVATASAPQVSVPAAWVGV